MGHVLNYFYINLPYIFCTPKNIYYDLTFLFSIEHIDKCFIILTWYEIKHNNVLLIFKEWLFPPHLYLLLFSILILFTYSNYSSPLLTGLIGCNEYPEPYSTKIALLSKLTWENNKNVTSKYTRLRFAKKK